VFTGQVPGSSIRSHRPVAAAVRESVR
jgi:hypothetical protein